MSQRWRLTIARTADGADVIHRDAVAAWSAILDALATAAASQRPVAPAGDEGARAAGGADQDGARGRVTFAAPAPLGMTSRGELVDVVLPVGRVDLARLRAVVQAGLPHGHRLVDAHDVWVGEPSLPALVVAADYRVEVLPAGDGESSALPELVDRAIATLLARPVIVRPGRETGRPASNLRPLIVDLRRSPDAPTNGLAADPTEPGVSGATDALVLAMRLRVDPEHGSGRPEEVVEALASAGHPLAVATVERLGFVLRDPPRATRPSVPGSGPARPARRRPGATTRRS